MSNEAPKSVELPAGHVGILSSGKMGPLEEVGPDAECPVCRLPFQPGDFYTLIPIGPGLAPESRRAARFNMPYPMGCLAVCWPCHSGEEPASLEGRKLRPINEAIQAVNRERAAQLEKWGVQSHHAYRWLAIITEELGEASEAVLDGDAEWYYRELTQVAASALSALESAFRAGFVGGTEMITDELKVQTKWPNTNAPADEAADDER